MFTFSIHPLAAGSPDIEGEAYAGFAADIVKYGLRTPIDVRLLAGDVGEIVDGRHRFSVLKENGFKLILEGRPNPAFFRIVKLKDDEVDAYHASLNLWRRMLNKTEWRAEMKRLIAAGKSVAEVARESRVSKATVYRETGSERTTNKTERDDKIKAGLASGKSVREVAKETGAPKSTVDRVSQNSQNAKNGTPKAAKPKKEKEARTLKTADDKGRVGQTDIVGDIVTPEILLAFEQLCDEQKKSRQTMINELIVARVRQPPMPKLAREQRVEFERVMREYKRALWVEYQLDVSDKSRKDIETILGPLKLKMLADADKVLKQRKGVFTPDEYKKILACLHPDSSPGVKQKENAFALFNNKKVLLLAEKDDPRAVDDIPSLAELLSRRKGRTVKEATGGTAPARRASP